MRSGRLAISLVAAGALSLGPRWAEQPQIVVGPNILITRDGDVPHYEVMIAVNPLDPKQMMVGSITMARFAGGQMNKAYSSRDGGFTWTDVAFPESVAESSGDPQVAFSALGTPIFTALTFNRGRRPSVFLHVYRSNDGGTHWDPPANLGGSYDHEMIAVDRTVGRFAHRMYLGVMYGPYPRYIVGVFRSDDDGRSWIGPAKAAEVPGLGINVNPLLVLSDGTLIVTIDDFAHTDSTRRASPDKHMWLASSTDGGVTFGEPWRIGTQRRDTKAEDEAEIRGTAIEQTEKPSWAVDRGSTRFRDRVYMTWNDVSRGRMRVWFSRSSDRGRTWTPPAVLSPDVPASVAQYHPTVAVNDSGVVGITWFDTRNVPSGLGYDEYFTASVDGGESFLPPARVSSASSWPLGQGNLTPTAFSVGTDTSGIHVGLQSAYSFRTSVGDYMGLTTDRDGNFLAAWADSRSGTAQIQLSQIAVRAGSAARVPSRFTERDVTTRVTAILDPARYDSTTGVMLLPIRLRNTSTDTLYGPITVEAVSIIDARDLAKVPDMPPPAILNASNQKAGAGATFDYTRALRDWHALPPGAVSEAVGWRIRTSNAHHTAAPITLRVRARVTY